MAEVVGAFLPKCFILVARHDPTSGSRLETRRAPLILSVDISHGNTARVLECWGLVLAGTRQLWQSSVRSSNDVLTFHI